MDYSVKERKWSDIDPNGDITMKMRKAFDNELKNYPECNSQQRDNIRKALLYLHTSSTNYFGDDDHRPDTVIHDLINKEIPFEIIEDLPFFVDGYSQGTG